VRALSDLIHSEIRDPAARVRRFRGPPERRTTNMRDIPLQRFAGSVSASGRYGLPTFAGIRLDRRLAIVLGLLGLLIVLQAVGLLGSHTFLLAAGPISIFQTLQDERKSVTSERDAVIAAAEAATANGTQKGFTDEQREKLTALKERVGQIDADLALEGFSREAARAATPVEGADGSPNLLDTPKPFRSLGEQLGAVARAALSPHSQVNPGLVQLNASAAGASEIVGSDGGFLVQSDFSGELLSLVHDTGKLAAKAKKRQIGAGFNGTKFNVIDETSRVDGSRYGGVQAYWTGEAAQMTAKRPKYHQEEIALQKLTGLYVATDEELQDVVALESNATDAFVEEFGFKLDDAMIRGTGAGMPLGILNSGVLVSVAKETGQSAATFAYENAVKMFARLWAPSMGDALWYINQDVYPQIWTMALVVGVGGAPAFVPPGGANQSPFGTLLGRPIQPIEQCSTLGTQGDVFLADFGQYVLIEKGGIQSASSIHVYFDTDQTAFRWTLRTNGRPWRKSALTPFKGSNTQSSFVTLDTRS
jgi:HK97 family phage major capsid protein